MIKSKKELSVSRIERVCKVVIKRGAFGFVMG